MIRNPFALIVALAAMSAAAFTEQSRQAFAFWTLQNGQREGGSVIRKVSQKKRRKKARYSRKKK
jgi:hypothetical protein